MREPAREVHSLVEFELVVDPLPLLYRRVVLLVDRGQLGAPPVERSPALPRVRDDVGAELQRPPQVERARVDLLPHVDGARLAAVLLQRDPGPRTSNKGENKMTGEETRIRTEDEIEYDNLEMLKRMVEFA